MRPFKRKSLRRRCILISNEPDHSSVYRRVWMRCQSVPIWWRLYLHVFSSSTQNSYCAFSLFLNKDSLKRSSWQSGKITCNSLFFFTKQRSTSRFLAFLVTQPVYLRALFNVFPYCALYITYYLIAQNVFNIALSQDFWKALYRNVMHLRFHTPLKS